ncbi:DNA/RNA non-specific endonuclease [Nannocystis radixulma]|uniref:Serine protease n=1 Tax=Nannocystis radixulma TaxID=2995305 RepID=A0ABT5BDX6_9BACT|nr:DNA/RNA non-specific endonuclease [Nannocystis radixulma]MDC0672364.1 DNA/RNA non-specific endonuclease [Nannocystis radixulma]
MSIDATLMQETEARFAEAIGRGRARPAVSSDRWKAAREDAERRQNEKVPESLTGVPPVIIDDSLLERILGRNDLVGIGFFDSMRQCARAVCLIELALGFGTGSVIAPGLVLTNHHVLPSVEAARSATAMFGFEAAGATGERFKLAPESFFVTDTALDYTVVAVSGDRDALARYGTLALAPDLPAVLVLGEPMNIIQHPDGGPKQYAVRENEILEVMENFVHYRSDTNPGSSGSPVFDGRWRLVALHHSGVARRDPSGAPLTRDGRRWTPMMGEAAVDWIANEGVRIDAILRDLFARVNAEIRRTRLADLPDVTDAPEVHPRTYGPAATSPQPGEARTDGRPAEPTELSGRNISLTIPLHVELSIDGARQAAQLAPLEKAPPPGAEAFGIDEAYTERRGYDPVFLGSEVPMPTLTPAAMKLVSRDQTRDGVDNHILRYHHFSIIMHRERRMQFLSAWNTTRDPRRTGKKSHEELSRGRDRWIFDPRIPMLHQIADRELYAGTEFDLGHMVRREDAYWSDHDEAQAAFANFDTFHYTNCTPRHYRFNRPDQGGRWGELELHIGQALAAEDLCVFAGPVFGEDDRRVRGVAIPQAFWKVIVALDRSGGLGVYAFVLSQSSLVAGMSEEFAPGPFRREQCSLAHLEGLTEVRFPSTLHEADVMRGRPVEVVALTTLESVQLQPEVVDLPAEESAGRSEPEEVVLDALPPELLLASRERQALRAALVADGFEFVVSDLDAWDPDAELRVAFLEPIDSVCRAIESCLRQIEDVCGVRFICKAADGRYLRWRLDDRRHAGEIRVSFDMDGYWSLIGRDSVDLDLSSRDGTIGGRPHQRSLNLGGFARAMPSTWQGTVLHEFLHALGVHHEHQHLHGPCQADFRWDDDPGYVRTKNARGVYIPDRRGRRPGIYTYLSGAPNNWPRSRVDDNMRADPEAELRYGPFDRASVMLYRFPNMFYGDSASRCRPTTDGQRLSPGDIEALQSLYPPARESLAPLITRRESLIDRLLRLSTRTGFSGHESTARPARPRYERWVERVRRSLP